MTINDLIGKKVLASKIYFGSKRYFDSMEIVDVDNDNVAIIGIESSWLGDIDITNGDKELVESFVKATASTYWQKLKKFEWNSTPNKEITLYNKKEILDILKQKKQVVKYDNKYWVDSDNNKWSCQVYSQKRAEYFSATCCDCNNCIDCESCMNCDNCNDCKDCVNCNNCNSCYNCENCNDCNTCNDCEDCKDCSDCKNGNDCNHCIDCVDCEGSSDCKNCYKCNGCIECNNCVNCCLCDNCDNCTSYHECKNCIN